MSENNRIRRLRVAIVGAGPAGSALAILLAREGAAVTLFDDGRRPELLVGESLVPAVIPILQRLDLEKVFVAICGHMGRQAPERGIHKPTRAHEQGPS